MLEASSTLNMEILMLKDLAKFLSEILSAINVNRLKKIQIFEILYNIGNAKEIVTRLVILRCNKLQL